MMPERDAEVGFVVRDGHQWLFAPVPPALPSVTDLESVLGRLAALDGPRNERETPAAEPLPDDAVLAPVWAWVGAVVPGGIRLEGNNGTELVLDEDDLRLLDALDGPVPLGALQETTGIIDAAHRLGALVAMGRLRLVEPDGDPTGSMTAPSTADDPEPGSEPRTVPPPLRRVADGRVGVHAVWQERVGPPLSLGMLTAAARHWDGGTLNEHFDIQRPETAEEFLAALATDPGPAVLLCSNYVWSVTENLEIARRAKALCPELVVIHGGPSTPKYPGDAERFLDDHGDVADVLVRDEGEVTLCRILEVLKAEQRLDPARLVDVPGITFRDPSSGDLVRTADPERIADLDTLPSPYLTGEFDHIDPSAWLYAVSMETNRGCPYGCTFCDWGSATLSRIRKFDLGRVLAEFQWAADRGIGAIQICDANFGIMSRDVDIARGLADIRRHRGGPAFLSFTPAKNTTKHVTKIFDAVIDAGILVSTAISLQTTDEATLDAVERSNISTDGYLALAADLRRRSLPLTGDLLIGLPGQTYDSYKADLQFFIEHEISPRSWSLRTLPNAPMNEPGYRERFDIEVDDHQIVTSTSTMDSASRERMLALRKVQVVADQYGVLSHVMRLLQWDHGIAMTDLLDHLVEVTSRTPTRFPLLTWVFEYFDLHPTAPVGWAAFYDELADLIAEDYGLGPDRSDLRSVLTVQLALMPAPQRHFPFTVQLDHDYVGYHRAATASLYMTGRASTPGRPLADHPPVPLTISSDPLGLCDVGLHFDGDSRNESMLGQFWLGVGSSHELLSDLTRVSPAFRSLDIAAQVTRDGPTSAPGSDDRRATSVSIGRHVD